MNLVEESDGTVLVGEIADLLDGSNRSAHGVDRLESNDLGAVRRSSRLALPALERRGRANYSRLKRQLLELILEVDEVVVLPDHLLRARVTDALDHGGVVALVGEDDTSREFSSEGAHCV